MSHWVKRIVVAFNSFFLHVLNRRFVGEEEDCSEFRLEII